MKVPNINRKHINEDIFTIDEFGNTFAKDAEYIEALTGYNGSPIDIPEDIEDPINWIEDNMDNQSDEPILNQYVECLTNIVPDVLPSYIDKIEWKRKQPEYIEFQVRMMIEEDELDTLMDKRYQDEVVVPYRKELREWYMKRKSNKLTNGTEDTSTEGSGSN